MAQTETLSTGSYIINMGVVPQTQSNALKPYGLVYDLLKNYNVQVKWVISQTKVKDGADFTYNGVQYKGGTFIIPAQYRTAAVNSRISFFGVTGTTTTSPLTVNVTHTLTTAPKWTLDYQNGNIAAGFFEDAGIPASAYDTKTPAQLNGCDEIYVMPHADADWSYYGPLRNWVLNFRGSFWGGCRTGSQIENLFNPAAPAEQMNFLSNNVGAAGNALVPYDSHADGTPPYIHQFPTSTVAQYMGITDGAHQNGSEQIYLPKLNGSWRATTQVITYDPTQSNVPALSPGPASAIVFGRAYGNPNSGLVMYEGGHNIGGTGAQEIAAQRAFWNFSFLSSTEVLPGGCVGSISDFVWNDVNGNGLQDSGEPGISGIEVTLTRPDLTTATTTTSATGYYQFGNLAAGTYKVTFPTTIAGGFALTNQNAGSDDSKDSDPDRATGLVNNIVIGPGQNDPTVDAGYVPTNCTPPPATLCGPPASFTHTTIANGNWTSASTWLGGVVPSVENISNQKIKIIHDVTVQNNNIKLTNGSIIYITGGGRLTLRNGNLELMDGNQTTTEKLLIDNGSLRTSGNVQQSGSATVVCAVNSKLEIGDEDASSTPTAFTSGFFSSLNNYTSADFQNTNGYRRLEGSCLNVTHDLQNDGGTDIFITVCAEIGDQGPISGPHGNNGGFDGQDNGNIQIQSTVGTNSKYYDSEFYIPNGSLQNSRDFLTCNVDYRLTNGNFQNQAGGIITGTDNVIYINHPSNGIIQNAGSWNWSTIEKWRTDNTTSPTGLSGTAVTESTQTAILTEFGSCNCTQPNLTLGNRVFNDINNNGIDDTEAGISGVTVNLYKDDNNDNVADGTSIATTTTNATGNYTFSSLSPGNYIVGVVTPAGFTSSAVNGGDPDNNIDLDDNGQVIAGSETRGLAITLAAGAEPNGDINNTYDFGFSAPSGPLTLGNTIFFDRNRSGMYDAGDSVAAGIIVRLYQDANNDNVPDGAFIQAASTNGSGEYSFTNLVAGNYIVGAVIPPVHAITVINGGDPDNNIDNDNNAINNVSGEARGNSITLATGTEPTAGNTNNTYDIGFYNPTLPPNGGQNCFTGTNPLVYAKSFWNVNANSQTVTLRVTFSKKFVDNTYGTSAIGWPNGHTFGNLTGSDHLQWSIRDANGVEKLAFKQDYVSASAAFPSGFGCLGFGGDGGTPTVGLASDVLSFRTSIASNLNDYGYVLTTNSPLTDTNYTPNPTYPNWIYDVWYEITVKASVFGTAGFGFVNVASVHASPSKTGNNTEIITNTPCVSAIGDRVWYDTDRDGIQDAGENGIRGVTVKLRNASNVVIATQVTNTTGNYLFNNLQPGVYYVEFPVSVYGYKMSPAYVGTNRNIDSDPSTTTGITPAINLGTADANYTIDAGYAPDCECVNSTSNLLVNPSFENGTTGWSWSGGTLTTGIDYVACGTKNGFNNWSSGTSKVWQDVNITAGSTIAFSAFAGTHAPGIACSPKLSFVFLNAANAVISQSDVTVTRVVGDYNNQLEQYSITAVAPAGSVKVRVQSTITCNTMKLDAFCLTVTALPGSIGDRVWNDTDADGIQDAGEVGIAGITLVLLNASGQPIATTTTDAFGNYKFSGLPPADYSVRVTPPANYTLSAKTQGGDTNLDSDFDPITYTTGTITLAAGQNRTDIDAGLNFAQLQPASVGDRVWLDHNGDGVQDAGEPGVSNILVTLYNNTGTPVRFTYTDVNGNYLFTDVTPGNYTVGFSLPPAFVFSPNNGAVSVANNSDAIPATGRTASFTVNAGDQIRYVDAGIKQQQSANGSIGDYVWNDLDKDGVQEAGEPGIAGVTVSLLNATTNAIITTTTTDATGNYIFNDVPAGNYKVEFVTPAGYTTTTKLNSNVTASGTDSDVDPATSRTAAFTLAAGQRITTVDAGYWKTTGGTGKIGDRVWLDANQNGVQDAGEANVQGVTVTLYDAANTAVKTAVTNANGNYLFTDLDAGNYTVGFSNIPQGYTFTTQGLGTAATGSDANPVTGRTATIALAAGQTNLDIDAGIRSMMAGTASIGNRVWNDINNNGIQDAGEPGIQGVTAELLDGAGNPVDSDPVTPGIQPTTRVTNALGEYLFTGLAGGDYRVRFSTLPAGYNASPKAAGTNRDIDSDGNPIAAGTSTTDIVSVATGEERLDIDFGLHNPTAPNGQLGDYVWFDSNNNGVQEATEQGVPGVTVSLLNASNTVIATTVTDANGNYRFVNLANATYSVMFSNLPAGFVFSPKDLGGNDNLDSDADPVTGQTGTYTIAAGNTNLTVDAGIYSTRAALGDYVWFDADSDGTQDAIEKGIAGITVFLYDANNVALTSAVTDQGGRYFFSNLNPGTYTVGFSTVPTKLAFTLKDVVAAGDAADSDVDPATGKTGPVTLTAGQVNLTVDAGVRPVVPATIGDFVWFDLNRDGIQDAGEPGVPGVIATLYNAANQPLGSAVTDGNGAYLISNVPAGTGYYVVFSNKPDPAAPWTLQNVGGTAASNNSKADATGKTTPFNVSEGDNIRNIDAGVHRLINIRGNVWNDANGLTDLEINKTGTQAIPNSLNIYLVDVATNLIVQAESILPDGSYSFLDVNINTSYKVVLSTVVAFPGQASPIPFLPSGWQRVGENLGAGPLSGSDGVPNGLLFIDTETTDIIDANFGIRVKSGEVIIG